MTLSVVLCTYNGSRYLREQLNSLVTQTRLPDQMVAYDDASTDGTVSILRECAESAPFPVEIHVNRSNLGFVGNFEAGISAATGDIIALCDQDDVWRPNKLSMLEEIFARRPDVGLVFSNGDVVDDTLVPMNLTLFEYADFARDKQTRLRQGGAFDVMLDANVVTGATMAFRSSIRPLALPIPRDTGRYHDAWIALVASAVSEVAFIEQPLIDYRQHRDQVTGVRRADRSTILGRDHYQHHAEFLELLDGRLATGGDAEKLADSRRRLSDRLAHVRFRAAIPEARSNRIFPVVRELLSGRYGRYSNGIRSVARDLLSR